MHNTFFYFLFFSKHKDKEKEVWIHRGATCVSLKLMNWLELFVDCDDVNEKLDLFFCRYNMLSFVLFSAAVD